MGERFDRDEDHQPGVHEQADRGGHPDLPGFRVEVRRHADLFLDLLDVAPEDDRDVGDVQPHQNERVQGVDPAAERDEESPRRRQEEERDLEGDVAIERDGVGERPRPIPDRGIRGRPGLVDGEEGDPGPPQADEDPVGAGHVRDGEVGIVTGPGEALPVRVYRRLWEVCDPIHEPGREPGTGLRRRAAGAGVEREQGVDRVLGGHREHREHRDRKGPRDVLLGRLGAPRQEKGGPEDGDPAGHHDDGGVEAVDGPGGEHAHPGEREHDRGEDGHQRMTET